MKHFFLRGRTGRLLLVVALLLLITAAFFAFASVFMAWDPDGHLIRSWLHDSRWGLFAWRLTLYAGMVTAWLMTVRPRLLKRFPETRSRLPRTELTCVLFILATEYVAWSGAA